MSKKYNSVLLLLIFTLAVALFSFTSCKNDPAPTAAPRAGEIPSVPNSQTKINSLGAEQETVISDLTTSFGSFFVSYMETYEDILLEWVDNQKGLSLNKGISLSSPEDSGTFRGNAYEHGEISGSIEYVDTENSYFLFVNTDITIEALGWNNKSISIKYDLMEDNPIYLYTGDNGNADVADICLDYANNNKFYLNENTTAVSDPTEIARLRTIFDYLGFIGVKALSKATAEVTDANISLTYDEDNVASFLVNGQVQFNAELAESVDENSLVFFNEDDDIDPMEEMFLSFSATLTDLSVQASVSTKVGTDSEMLSGSLDVKNLSLIRVYGDEAASIISLEKAALSLSNSDDNVILSLELSDLSIDMSKSSLSSVSKGSRRVMRSFRFGGSTTIGVGLKVGENSAGVVTDLEFTLGTLSRMPFISFTPKAAVLNGSFYNTSEVKNLLIDYFDMLLLSLTGRN